MRVGVDRCLFLLRMLRRDHLFDSEVDWVHLWGTFTVTAFNNMLGRRVHLRKVAVASGEAWQRFIVS